MFDTLSRHDQSLGRPSDRQQGSLRRLSLPPAGQIEPLRALDLLLAAFNDLHATRDKTVSYKTRHERRLFLRAFFRDLKAKAGFSTIPDPRNLGHKHIRAMAQVWQREALATGTIHIYLSMLRTLAGWMGKHGFVQNAAFYGLDAKHSEVATQDHSWSAHDIDAAKVIAEISAFDRHVGAQLSVMLAFGLRRKEAVMLKPHVCVVACDTLASAVPEPRAEQYLRIKPGAKGGRERLIPIDSPERLAALQQAKGVTLGQEDPLGDPTRSLKQNLQRFEYVMQRFELTRRARGVTGHGLRHQHLNDTYEHTAGVSSPVRGGVVPGAPGAGLAVARLAGHGRRRASTAYLGSLRSQRGHARPVEPADAEPPSSTSAAKPEEGGANLVWPPLPTH